MPLDKVDFIRAKTKETITALRRNILPDIDNIERREELIAWTIPDYGWVVLNSDGVAKGTPGPAGVGGLIRDYTGACLAFFANNLGECTAMRAELATLMRGLIIARELGVKQLEVRMDNLACTQIMMKDAAHFGSNLQLVRQCKSLISQPDWTVVLSHCYREANVAADWLANRGVVNDIPSNSSIQDFPEFAAILRDDLIGVAFPRLVRSG